MYRLKNLPERRRHFGIGVNTVAVLAGIAPSRLTAITNKEEPRLSEAITLAKILSCPIIPDLTEPPVHPRDPISPHELERLFTVYRAGGDLPLGAAVEIARHLGLSDPIELDVSPLTRQIWDVINVNERVPAAQGRCPWCGAMDSHLPTCLPDRLWRRVTIPVNQLAAIMPRPPKMGTRRAGLMAPGLKFAREAVRPAITQREMAERLGLRAKGHYSQMEQCRRILTYDMAQACAAMLGTTTDVLYAHTPRGGTLTGDEVASIVDRTPPPPPPSNPFAPPPGYVLEEGSIIE